MVRQIGGNEILVTSKNSIQSEIVILNLLIKSRFFHYVKEFIIYDRRVNGGDESKKPPSLSVPKRPSMKVINDNKRIQGF